MSIWFFFFKQKTAYEMRISDWSSDVCSSDLIGPHRKQSRIVFRPQGLARGPLDSDLAAIAIEDRKREIKERANNAVITAVARQAHAKIERRELIENCLAHQSFQIGSASCRERVCQYV